MPVDPVDVDLNRHLSELDADALRTLCMEEIEKALKSIIEEDWKEGGGLTYAEFIEWAYAGLQQPEHTKGWEK